VTYTWSREVVVDRLARGLAPFARLGVPCEVRVAAALIGLHVEHLRVHRDWQLVRRAVGSAGGCRVNPAWRVAAVEISNESAVSALGVTAERDGWGQLIVAVGDIHTAESFPDSLASKQQSVRIPPGCCSSRAGAEVIVLGASTRKQKLPYLRRCSAVPVESDTRVPARTRRASRARPVPSSPFAQVDAHLESPAQDT
jgi:hypothetical protein